MNEKIKLIIELGRLRFLIGGFLLYTLGAFLALTSGVNFSLTLFVFGYAIMLPAHLSLSYSNNYFDVEVDKLDKPGFLSGGSRVLVEYPEILPLCKHIAIFLMAMSILLAIIFVAIFSYPVIFLGFVVFGNLLGWFYTAPPVRLAYHGVGEIANIINVGILMPGIGYWIMNGSLDLFFFTFSVALMLYGLDFILIVETPDMESDKIGNKHTIVANKGRKFAYKLIMVSVFLSSTYFLLLSISGIYQQYLNYFIIFTLSLIPLLMAIFGWIKKPFFKEIGISTAKNNMIALLLFFTSLNIYLLLMYVK